MANVAPTRSNLLQRRDQLRLASKGVDLLKRKRDALIGEFFGLVKESLAARRSLSSTSQEAYFSLFLANAWDGPEAVDSLSLASKSGLDLDIKVENIFGVRVPQVQPPEFDTDLPFSPVGAGARTLDAASQFRQLTKALIDVAATETRLRRIGEEIKKTSRRVNALEQVVIPGISREIKDIRSVLDQRALEEVTVLKRIKAKLEAREDEKKGGGASASPNGAYPENTTSMAHTVKDRSAVATLTNDPVNSASSNASSASAEKDDSEGLKGQTTSAGAAEMTAGSSASGVASTQGDSGNASGSSSAAQATNENLHAKKAVDTSSNVSGETAGHTSTAATDTDNSASSVQPDEAHDVTTSTSESSSKDASISTSETSTSHAGSTETSHLAKDAGVGTGSDDMSSDINQSSSEESVSSREASASAADDATKAATSISGEKLNSEAVSGSQSGEGVHGQVSSSATAQDGSQVGSVASSETNDVASAEASSETNVNDLATGFASTGTESGSDSGTEAQPITSSLVSSDAQAGGSAESETSQETNLASGVSAKSSSATSAGSIDWDKYIEDVKNYSSNVNEEIVRRIVRSQGANLNNRDASLVACSQKKELNYIKKNFLKGKLGRSESNKVLDKALQDVCEQMGRGNRTKLRTTFYYLLTEKFDAFDVWR